MVYHRKIECQGDVDPPTRIAVEVLEGDVQVLVDDVRARVDGVLVLVGDDVQVLAGDDVQVEVACLAAMDILVEGNMVAKHIELVQEPC